MNLLQIVFGVVPLAVTRPMFLPQMAFATGTLTGAVNLLAPGMMTQSYPTLLPFPSVPYAQHIVCWKNEVVLSVLVRLSNTTLSCEPVERKKSTEINPDALVARKKHKTVYFVLCRSSRLKFQFNSIEISPEIARSLAAAEKQTLKLFKRIRKEAFCDIW